MFFDDRTRSLIRFVVTAAFLLKMERDDRTLLHADALSYFHEIVFGVALNRTSEIYDLTIFRVDRETSFRNFKLSDFFNRSMNRNIPFSALHANVQRERKG